jgi:hypothetical protein
LLVGRSEHLQPADYPNLLTSVRVSFAIFALLCALGLGAVLIGRTRPHTADVRTH